VHNLGHVCTVECLVICHNCQQQAQKVYHNVKSELCGVCRCNVRLVREGGSDEVEEKAKDGAVVAVCSNTIL
jgi:hypothetical protein